MATLKDLTDGNIAAIKEQLASVDLTKEAEFIANWSYKQYFLKDAGVEHYKLLAWVSSLFPNQTIMDIGTHYGNSSLAMSQPKDAKLVSYDIVEMKQLFQPYPANCQYKIGDFREDPETLSSPFIFIDVDPHDGIQEKNFHEFFLSKSYKGITLWDDINANQEMRDWWYSIDGSTVIKIDLTEIGHWSGTGMIIYA